MGIAIEAPQQREDNDMPAKQGSSPKVKNAGKHKRVVANPKPVNRTGGRKPQERRITKPERVQAIRLRVLAEAKKFIELDRVELTNEIAEHLSFLCGLGREGTLAHWFKATESATDEDSASLIDMIYTAQMSATQKAFYKACKVVTDSEFVFIGDRHALPGRTHLFFRLLQERAEQEAKAEAERRAAARKRRNSGRPRQTPSGDIGQKLAAAGHSNGSSATVANRVAKASGLVG